MPARLAAPVLTVDAGKMNGIDTRNVESLFGMWTVFSKCAEYMEEGRRLENMSWRIWNRETFCCGRAPSGTTASITPSTTPSIEDFRSLHLTTDVPELSASVESIASDDASPSEQQHQQPHSSLAPVNIQRASDSKSFTGSQSSSRGKERHLTSMGLTKMVISIKERKSLQPLSTALADAVSTVPSSFVILSSPSATQPLSSSATPTQAERTCEITPKATANDANLRRPSESSTASIAPLSSPESAYTSMKASEIESDTSVDIMHSHSIIRGFSPKQTSSYRSSSHLAPPSLPVKPLVHARVEASKQKSGAFFIGGGSSGDDESSFEDKRPRHAPPSALSVVLKKPMEKKQTSFKDEVESRTIRNRESHDDVFESDEDISESAIEDDDEDGSDWEDDGTDSEPSLEEQKMFQRVDSRPNLVSRRSLLTTLMHQPDRAAALVDMALHALPRQRSRTSSPSGPSVAASPGAILLNPHVQIPRSQPIIMTTSNIHPPALSPRTTRRNMLATELTESLRKHLLWERQQKPNAKANLLKRRHTAQDVVAAKHFPTGPSTGTTSRTNSWDPAGFVEQGLGDFNERGW